MYRIFNVALASDLALPELPKLGSAAGMPVYRFRVNSLEDLAAQFDGVEWFHDWQDPNGNVTIRAGRHKSHHWLRFPGLADFAIGLAERQIIAFPEHTTEQTTLRHLLLDQVMPRVLGQEGALILHAGAVQLVNGRMLGFVGQTGHGKSTLVSSFEQNGARLITDDCLMVMLDQSTVRVVPNYPGVRLFDDSIAAIYGAHKAVAEVAQYTTKRRLVMPVEGVRGESEATSLDALFLLGDPASADDKCIEIRPAAGASALMKLVEQSFILDNTDRTLLKEHFRGFGTILRGRLRCYELNYERDHNRLGELRTAIEQAVV